MADELVTLSFTQQELGAIALGLHVVIGDTLPRSRQHQPREIDQTMHGLLEIDAKLALEKVRRAQTQGDAGFLSGEGE